MWIFRSNILYSPDGGMWSARSGRVGGALPIPKGMYTIGKPTGIDAAVKKNIDFCDTNGSDNGGPFAWWCALTPDPHVTTRGQPGKGRFGIHPDGGEPGTDGCIGLTDLNTRSTYNALRDTLDRRLKVE